MTKAKALKQEKKQREKIWLPFVKFYTRFKTPWWLFIGSALGSILYTEMSLQLAEYTISINIGELYNSVILGYVGWTLAMALITIVYNMMSAYGGGIVTLRARNLIWGKIVRLPATAFDTEQPSSFISRITSDVPQASTTITYICLFVSSIYSFVRAFITLFLYDVPLTLWLLLVIPAAVGVFWAVGKTQYYSYKKIYAAINRMTTFFSEHLATMKHTKAQVMEEEEIQAGYAEIEKRYRSDVFYGIMVAVQVTLNSIYTKIAFIILVLAGKKRIDSGAMESTGIATASTYLDYVQKYLAEILTQYQTIKGVQGVIGRVADLAETPVEETKRISPMPEECRDLVLSDVSFSYPTGAEVLHHLSVTIPEGKKTAVVGENGCGKSTLFKLLMRFYEPTSGEIYYGEDKASDIHLDEWRVSFGYVLQNSPILSGTIRDNIVYGCRGEVSEERIIEAAKIANAYDFIMEFPEGFDKDVGEGGMHLSGGQRQRIAIARAVIADPKILLMDEATASLDIQSDRLVWEATEKLMEGRTTILIAHDMHAVTDADNIIVLNRGEVEAFGTHEEVMASSGTYRHFVELQSSAEVRNGTEAVDGI